MASVGYDEIFSSFLGAISDYDFAALDATSATESMSEFLHKSLADPFIRKLFSTIVLNDELQSLEYHMKNETNEEEDNEFVINVLSERMVASWLKPYVYSKSNIAQYFGGKESHFFSQANHVEQLRGLLRDIKLEVRKMVRDRGYMNSSDTEG